MGPLSIHLPYIQKYNGKIIVVKYGGNAMINEQLKQQVMEDMVLAGKINKTLVNLLGMKGGARPWAFPVWTAASLKPACAIPAWVM